MALNATKSQVRHICSASIPVSQISIFFALCGQSFSNYRAIMRQIHRMTPTRPWKLQSQNTLHTFVLLSIPSPRFQSVSLLWPTLFDLQATITLNTTRTRVHHIYTSTGSLSRKWEPGNAQRKLMHIDHPWRLLLLLILKNPKCSSTCQNDGQFYADYANTM